MRSGRRFTRRGVASCALVLACLLAGASGSVRAAVRDPGVQPALSVAAGPTSKAVLLFFVASDCQVSNRYFPEMERLRAKFGPLGVSTFFVYANPGETRSGVDAHQREFGAPVEAVWMDAGGLATLAGATTTPEAALLVRNGGRWRPVYAGRIDDRYIHIGLERTAVQHHDAEDAVEAVLNGKPVPAPGGPPVGCALMRSDSGAMAGGH